MNESIFSRRALSRGIKKFLALEEVELTVLDVKDVHHLLVLPGNYGHQIGFYKLRPFLTDIAFLENQYQFVFLLKQAASSVVATEYHLCDFERHLAPQLPVFVPRAVTADVRGGWIILETLDDLRDSLAWSADDYCQAVDNLAILHYKFWGLEEDLDHFDLNHPLVNAYPQTATAITTAVDTLIEQALLPELTTAPYQAAFQALIQNIDAISAPLRQEKFTLLHGDYWADNIACPVDGGRQMITGWQFASIGPAILDVVWFHQQTNAHYAPALPLADAIARYRAHLEEHQHQRWSDEQWALLWDHALLWLFMLRWLPWLASCTAETYTPHHTHFQANWLDPVLKVLAARLPTFPPP